MRDTVDVVVSGGGLAGLAAAAAFGAAGHRVLCVDPAPPVTDESDPAADLRTTAVLQPSALVLQQAGVWERLLPFAQPLQTMRIVDDGGRVRRDFDAAEVSDRPFGWNFPNWLLRRELVARLSELPGVRFRPGVAATALVARRAEALVGLSDGTRLAARLLVAADGRESPMRAALGIGARTIRYGQSALVFAVAHPVPHEGVSTEIHDRGGPFTLVPLADRDGAFRSAVVWMVPDAEARRLLALDPEAFGAAATARSFGLFGDLRLVSGRACWPIIARIADRFDGPSAALMAEAAHVVPPIGAQGLNMSMADLGTLLQMSARHGLGAPEGLAAYHRRRWPEVAARIAGVDLLNRASLAGMTPIRALRAAALGALHAPPLLRRALMRLGMGLAPADLAADRAGPVR
jgi:2-octaprenyl-6-methoxyphenol hydroxylase